MNHFFQWVRGAVPDGAVSKGVSKLGITCGKKALSGRRSYKSYMHIDITTTPNLKQHLCVIWEPLEAPNRPANHMKLHRVYALLFLCLIFSCLWPLWDSIFLETIIIFAIQFGAASAREITHSPSWSQFVPGVSVQSVSGGSRQWKPVWGLSRPGSHLSLSAHSYKHMHTYTQRISHCFWNECAVV